MELGSVRDQLNNLAILEPLAKQGGFFKASLLGKLKPLVAELAEDELGEYVSEYFSFEAKKNSEPRKLFCGWYKKESVRVALNNYGSEKKHFWQDWDGMSLKLRTELARLTYLEERVLYLNCGLDGNPPRVEEDIAKLPEFNCDAQYIWYVLDHVENKFSKAGVLDEYNERSDFFAKWWDEMYGEEAQLECANSEKCETVKKETEKANQTSGEADTGLVKEVSCLADGYIVDNSDVSKGCNKNVLVVGASGSGKSYSVVIPNLLRTYNTSVAVSLAKRDILDRFKDIFEDRGYVVRVLDFVKPDQSTYGYDPMLYVKTEEDVIRTSQGLIGASGCKNLNGGEDRYWNDSATGAIAAEIELVRLNAKSAGREASFADVVELHRAMKCDFHGKILSTNLDFLFAKAEELFPRNIATSNWRTLTVAVTTASCILSIVNTSYNIFTDDVMKMLRNPNKINFAEMGDQKTALFVLASPMNKALLNLQNLLYADLFKSLFEHAEKNDNYTLDVPVHVYADDFACSGKIEGFDTEYIPLFRQAGISCTLLCQSESQLKEIYKDSGAATIIDNCGTYLYFGGMDMDTITNVARKVDKSIKTVLSLPLEQLICFRRGNAPFIGRRYQTLEDEMYIEAFGKGKKASKAEVEIEPEQEEKIA